MLCVDIDECNSNNGGCEQTCSNVDGSFSCDCEIGFTLSGDGRTCLGLFDYIDYNNNATGVFNFAIVENRGLHTPSPDLECKWPVHKIPFRFCLGKSLYHSRTPINASKLPAAN